MKLDEKCNELSNAGKKEFQSTYNITDLFLSVNNYEDFFLSLLEGNKKVSQMPLLEGYNKIAHVPTMPIIKVEEVKEGE